MEAFLLGNCFGCPSSKGLAYRLSPPPVYNSWSEEMKQHIKKAPATKWIVPSYLYNKETWPPFEAGPAYLLTRSSAECMLQKSSNIPYFPLEDVYEDRIFWLKNAAAKDQIILDLRQLPSLSTMRGILLII